MTRCCSRKCCTTSLTAAAVITGLAGLLRPGGRMLVVMLPPTISYPLFAAALELFAARQPDPAGIAEADARGGPARGADRTRASRWPSRPDRYLQMVRNRYMSLLSAFDDASSGSGGGRDPRAHPGEQIEFTDTFAFVLGTAA